MQYRKDIDGLRALAVLPVVIYHIAQSYLKGGYVGVDIFFVISGYLISAQIIRDAQASQFSAVDFYARRIRRIIPAYAVLLIFVTIVVLCLYFPFETDKYAQSLLASIASLSNVYFWATINYFNPAGETMPLLHTWSLAVEEQFYFLFPIVIYAVLRWLPKQLKTTIMFLFVASLAACVASAWLSPLTGFYQLPMRAWELLLGTLLALGIIPLVAAPLLRNVIAGIGVGLIVAAMLLYTPTTLFPGYAAIVPCLGAAMIIYAGQEQDTLVARILSLTPFVFIGLISYSLYLWHWPLIAFQKANALLITTNSKILERGVVLAASIALASLSWCLIERPTRNRKLFSLRALFLVCGSSLGLLLLVAGIILSTHGLPDRFSPRANRLAAYANYDFEKAMRVGRCLLSERTPFSAFDQQECLPNVVGRRSYLLVGDSHAGALSAGLVATYKGANILQVTGSGCLPLLKSQPSAPSAACDNLTHFAFELLPELRTLDGVWLFGRFGNGDVSDHVHSTIQTAIALREKGLQVVIIGPNPEYRLSLPRLLALQELRQTPSFADRFLSPEPVIADKMLRDQAAAMSLRYVSLIDGLCSNGSCRMMATSEVPMLSDTDHLTAEGAAVVADLIAPQLLVNLKERKLE